MKIHLYMKKHLVHCCKNIFWYEDSFAYEKYLIHRCKNINWYEDSFAYEKHFIHCFKKH